MTPPSQEGNIEKTWRCLYNLCCLMVPKVGPNGDNLKRPHSVCQLRDPTAG